MSASARGANSAAAPDISSRDSQHADTDEPKPALTRFTRRIAFWVDPYVDLFLILVMILLFLVAVWVLFDAANQFWCSGGSQCAQPSSPQQGLFSVKIPRMVSDGLLIVIVMEIVETIRQQVKVSGRIYPALVRNFLIVGIVSAIRHLLAVGAQFSLQEGNPDLHLRASLMWELGLNAVIVLALVVGWILAKGLESSTEDHVTL